MASACVNKIGMSPENFLDSPPKYTSYGWLSPRISFSREDSKTSTTTGAQEKNPDLDSPAKDSTGDFEFRLDDPVIMLHADELFSEGKLVPLHLSSVRQLPASAVLAPATVELRSPETVQSFHRRSDEFSLSNDPYLFSPKAPRCSSRWRELLGLKKLSQNNTHNNKQENLKTSTTSFSSSGKPLRLFLNRNTKTSSSSTSDPSLSLPLLKESLDCSVSLSISSSRLSLSSSSSGHDHDDHPRLSLDLEKPISAHRSSSARARMVRVSTRRVPAESNPRVGRSPLRRAHQDPATITRGVSVDSPRMNPSGKVIFQSLERSSSSPSSFNGGSRYKHRGMERSYSANIRVTPVLNVPVCSLRGSSKTGGFGFGQLFSSQTLKKDSNNGGNFTSRNHHHHHHYQQSSTRNKESS